jgi:hypothetical protein
MTNSTRTPLLLLCLFTASLMAQEALPSETKAKLEIEELEKRWLASEDNPEVLQIILAQDCVVVSPAGITGKEERIAQAKEHAAAAQNETRRFNDLRIRVYGGVAIVNGTIAATDARTNATHKWLFTDVFTYRDRRWQVINTQRTVAAL